MKMIRIDRRGLTRYGRDSRMVAACKSCPKGRTGVTTKHHDPITREFIHTRDPGFQKILDRIPLYAQTDLPVLITGEPGTGKELVANALWATSLRPHRPFLKLNCAALMESLANSELFGHTPGAFTGAHRKKKGKFELAHQGTLFLDEIGDLPLCLQPRLLRAVEQGEIEPLGSDTPAWVNVRLLAATNQDLRQLIAWGRFRQDLYDRLATLTIHLPPLRERQGDILFLANYFIWTAAQQYGKGNMRLSTAIKKEMLNYSWPGNVRELKNVITRAVLLNQGAIIKEIDLEFLNSPGQSGTYRSAVTPLPTRPPAEELEALLQAEHGNVSALSRRLQVCTKTIYRWLRYYDIGLESYRV